MPTPIADMVEQMLSGGIPPDTIVLAVRAVELAVQENTRASLPADSAAARRRAWDRERKQKRRSGIPPDSENPSLIDSPLKEETIKNKEEVSKKERAHSTGIPPEFHRKKRKLAPLPDDWQPPQRSYNLAVSLGLSVEEIEPRFRDYLASSGKQYLDYDAGFCNFVRNTPKFNGGHNAKNGNVLPAQNKILERLAEFSQPIGNSDVRSPKGEAPVRLLSEGRCERPGDVHSGSDGDPGGLFPGSDPARH